MNRSIIFFSLCLFSFLSNAQVDKLLKNKDITWVAEVENDLLFQDFQPNRSLNDNIVNTLKISKTDDYATDNSAFLINKITNAIKTKKLVVFNDKNLTDRFSKSGYASVDTVQSVDPETYKMSMKVLINSNWIQGFRYMRVKQLVFYNSKNAHWGIQIIAVSPLFLIQNEDSIRREPSFWIPVDNKKLKLSSKSVVWAVKTSTCEASNIDFSKANILKNTLKEMPLTVFIDQAKSNKKFKAYNYHDCKEVLSPLNLAQRIVPEKDTIFPLDPETQLPIMSTPFIAQYDDFDVSKLKIVQDWFWDDKKQRLCVQTRALAPVRKHVYYVDYSLEMPLFYVMPK
jgi:Gliding motility associated protein GldN